MPNLSGNQSTIRQSGYSTRVFLSIPKEVSVLGGTLTANLGEGTKNLGYTLTSGSAGNVLEGMEIEFFRLGSSVGRLRVAPGTVTSTVLPVEEVSYGRFPFLSGDTFLVYRSWRLRGRLVNNSSSFERDSRITYSNQTSLYRPIANAGGPVVGFVSSGVLLAEFSGLASQVIDPDSGGTLSYSWNVGDGTITIGTSSSSVITVSFPAGFRWVSLTVTDSSNSQSSTTYVPVWAHEASGTNRPIDIENVSRSYSRSEGWSISFDTVEPKSPSSIPDGSLVVLWEQESYGSSQVSYGSMTGRNSNIKFVGYLDSDTSSSLPEDRNGNQRTVSFRGVSIVNRLKNLPGFSQVLESSSSPTSWLQAQSLTTRILLDYLLRWHTTLYFCHDAVFDEPTYPYPAFYLQQSTPLDQLNEILDGIDSFLDTDRNGRLLVTRRPEISVSSVRSSIVTTLTLTESDILEYSVERSHQSTVYQTELQGLIGGSTVSSSSAVFSRAPGITPGQGSNRITVDRVITSSQDELNERTGLRYSLENRTFFGLPSPRVSINLRGGYDVFSSSSEWVRLTVPIQYSSRLVGFSSSRFSIDQIDIDYDSSTGTKSVSITLIGETIAPPGITYLPPSETISDQISFSPIDFDFPTILDTEIESISPVFGSSSGSQTPLRVYALGIQSPGGLKRMVSFDYQLGSGTVESLDPSNTVTGIPQWACGDPFKPGRFFVLTDTGLWKTENRDAGSPTWTQVATNLQITGLSNNYGGYIEMSINRRGYIAISSGRNRFCYSFDYGNTWQRSSPNNTSLVDVVVRSEFTFGLSYYNHPSKANSGWVYATAFASSTLTIWLNKNWGSGTWEQVGTIGTNSTVRGALQLPYRRAGNLPNKNDDNQVYFVNHTVNNLNVVKWTARTKGGSTLWEGTNTSSLTKPVSVRSFRPFNSNTLNGDIVYLVRSDVRISKSVNGGASLVNLENGLLNDHGLGANAGNINGWPTNPNILLGWGSSTGAQEEQWFFGLNSGHIVYTPNGGTNWYDLSPSFGFTNYHTAYAELG